MSSKKFVRPTGSPGTVQTATTNSDALEELRLATQSLLSAASASAGVASANVEATRADIVAGTSSSLSLEAPAAGEAFAFAASSVLGSVVVPVHFSESPAVPPSVLARVPVPSIDRLELVFDRLSHAVDGFGVRVVVSIPRRDATNVRWIAVMRSRRAVPDLSRPHPGLSARGSEMLGAASPRSRAKNSDTGGVRESTLKEAGIDTAIAGHAPYVPGLGQRVVRETAPSASVDVSVLDDRAFAARAQPIRGDIAFDRLVVGSNLIERDVDELKSRHAIDVATKMAGPASAPVWTQVGILIPTEGASAMIGDVIEMSLIDGGVIYGSTYAYYAVAVEDPTLVRGHRSSIITTTVEESRPPVPPSVFVSFIDDGISMLCSTPDPVVERFEVYRRSSMGEPSELDVPSAFGIEGMPFSVATRGRLANGFVQIAELSAAPGVSSTFRDRRIVGGASYEYRVYSVDFFGNKAQTPASAIVAVPPPGESTGGLLIPSISVEVIGGTRKARVIVVNTDPHAQSVSITRRDLTDSSSTFSSPNTPARMLLGRRERLTNRDDVTSHAGWTGFFGGTGSVTFIDELSALDRVYQYRAVSTDRYGNASHGAISFPILISSRPVVDSPAALSASLAFSASSQPRGVLLSWRSGNVDVSPLELIGSRNALVDTSVRTLYQVERRSVDDPRWTRFPLVASLDFFDDIERTQERSKPPAPKLGGRYLYRVAAYQTGSFVSNYTDPVSVIVDAPVASPVGLRIRSPGMRARPLYVVLNWDMPDSGQVDSWEVERSAVNNFAAARMNLGSPDVVALLQFSPVGSVFWESSRARPRSFDVDPAPTRVANVVPTFTGEHSFVDDDVSLGNTYVYRIRSVGIFGQKSAWAHRAAGLRDAAFDSRLSALLTSGERAALTSDPTPMKLKTESA